VDSSEILQLLQHALPDTAKVTLHVHQQNRHLHITIVGDAVPTSHSSPLVELLVAEVRSFVVGIDTLTVWIRTVEQPEAQQIRVEDLTRPPAPTQIEQLGQYCFVKNRRLLTTALPSPHPDVARAVLAFHQLDIESQLEIAANLTAFFDRPATTSLDVFPTAQLDWLEDICAMSVENRKSVAVWLSRYCINRDRVLSELEASIRASQPDDIASDRSSAPTPNDPTPVGYIGTIAADLNVRLGSQWRIQVSTEENQLRIRVDAARAPRSAIATARVFAALQQVLLPPHLQTVALFGLQDGHRLAWKTQFQLPTAVTAAEPFDRFRFDNPAINAAAYPIALVVGMLLNTLVPILMYPFHVWTHEFGHATVAWLAGHRAIPLPFGWTPYVPQRELGVYLGILFLLGVLFWTGWREGRRWLMVLASGLAGLQCVMTWLLPRHMFELLFVFGGVGGEFYLSTALMVCFYFRLPDRWRWDFWRFVFLVVAASTLSQAFWRWHLITQGLQDIPWGSIFGAGDTNGDMDRLQGDFGWSPDRIIDTYANLGNACVLVLLVGYCFFLAKMNPYAWFALRQRTILWWTSGRKFG
jgi:hypothetical protein